RIEREIRAYIGWPSSRTTLFDKDLIVTKAKVVKDGLKPGSVANDKKRLIIGTSKGSIEVLRLKPAGKKEMDVQAFLAGVKR
ncbi:methionyl-tRNA formyltransferase, partial [Candidatus Saccharibacteria bacterium]|nr:methionyl-tRNA formyltransferase [Candidatus Saccharibacteria bacterium]